MQQDLEDIKKELNRVYNYLINLTPKDKKEVKFWERLANYFYYMSEFNKIENKDKISKIIELADIYNITVPIMSYRKGYELLYKFTGKDLLTIKNELKNEQKNKRTS